MQTSKGVSTLVKFFCLFLAIFFEGCGYHGVSKDQLAISIPYIQGDSKGNLNRAIAYDLSSNGLFSIVQSNAQRTLEVKIVKDRSDRVGFRYDTDNVSGSLEKNLLGIEDKRSITVEVCLIDSSSGKKLWGPFEISASIDYDYTDPGSPKDLLVVTTPMPQFSLGQLDAWDGAYEDAEVPLFHKLAEQITIAIIAQM